jgi:hypothetical protein
MTILGHFISPVLIAASVVGSVQQGTTSEPSPSVASQIRDLYFSDVVVRGTVKSVQRQTIPVSDFDPKSELQGYCAVRVVVIQIGELLRGSYTEPTIEVRIDVGNSAMSGDYEAGLELLIGAVSQPDVMSGAFVAAARYVRRDDGWVNPGCMVATDVLAIEQIREALQSQTLNEMINSADLIVVGTVETVTTERVRDPSSADEAYYDRIVLRPSEVLKGPRPKLVEFYSFAGGAYWPRGERLGPKRLEEGAIYCAFLTNASGRWILSSGTDALYYVSRAGDFHRTGFFAVQQRLPVTAKRLTEWVQEVNE